MRVDPPESFSARLRRETSAAHSLAEKTAFIRGFLGGSVSPEAYLQLLGALRTLYGALDRVLAEAGSRSGPLSTFAFPELRRTEALEADVLHFERLAGRVAPASPTAARYAAHLESLLAREPDFLVGHLYTRYLGDLSGGQILARILRRSLGLPGTDGTAFYEFPGIADHAAFKAMFRARLDAIPDEETLRRGIVRESLVSFELSRGIFEEIESSRLSIVRAHLLPSWMFRASGAGRTPRHGRG